MKIAIVYDSVTGNTKKIAEAVKKAVSEEELVYFGEPREQIEADFYFVGSWTDKGMCSQKTAEFLKKLRKKKIAYFGTAGFGGSEDYYRNLYSRAAGIVDESNEMLGYFYCQGKMPMGVRSRYVNMMKEHPEDKQLQVSIRNFDEALSHPDDNDIANALQWAESVIKV